MARLADIERRRRRRCHTNTAAEKRRPCIRACSTLGQTSQGHSRKRLVKRPPDHGLQGKVTVQVDVTEVPRDVRVGLAVPQHKRTNRHEVGRQDHPVGRLIIRSDACRSSSDRIFLRRSGGVAASISFKRGSSDMFSPFPVARPRHRTRKSKLI